jgi:hypothetical protein
MSPTIAAAAASDLRNGRPGGVSRRAGPVFGWNMKNPILKLLGLSWALAAPGLAKAQTSQPFELVCDVTDRVVITSTSMGPSDEITTRTQRYRVNPTARTVTAALSYNGQTRQWEERANLFSVSVLDDAQLAFCEGSPPCGVARTATQGRATATSTYRATIIDLRSGRLAGGSTIHSQAGNEELNINRTEDGQCRRS